MRWAPRAPLAIYHVKSNNCLIFTLVYLRLAFICWLGQLYHKYSRGSGFIIKFCGNLARQIWAPCHTVVRMAERSKAPDSRLNTFSARYGSGRSGLRMEAWVRIPLLTIYVFFFFCLIICLIKQRETAGSQLMCLK